MNRAKNVAEQKGTHRNESRRKKVSLVLVSRLESSKRGPGEEGVEKKFQ